ncbi:AAEL009135-PA, partial [Aedes aegypti]
RTKHVSFARSYTLTSFDEAMGGRPLSRLAAARSQERLIGGKKPTITLAQHQPSAAQYGTPLHSILQQPNQQPLLAQQLQQQHQQLQVGQQQPPSVHQHIHAHQHMQHLQPPHPGQLIMIEKIKRSAMKTQATQTEVYLNKKAAAPHHLSLSPRTIHRVKMVSQGAQTNGGLNGRKLTKSLSEAADRIQENGIDIGVDSIEHEQLHRTQSEEPPKSPFTITSPPSKSPLMQHFEMPSRTSDNYPLDKIMTHSRNHSQDSATSYRSTDGSRASYETKNGYVFETHSLPRRTCIHHKPEEFHTHTLPRRDYHPHHHHEIIFKDQLKMPPQELLISNGSVNQDIRSFDSNSLNRRMSSHHVAMQQDKQNQQRRASYAYVTPDTHTLTRRNSISHQQVQKVQPMIQTPIQQQHQPQPQIQKQPQQPPLQHPPQQQQFQPLVKPQPPIFSQPSLPPPSEKDDKEEQEIFIDFKPRVSPVPSPNAVKKKKLQKTLSEGEILVDRKKTKPTAQPPTSVISASEEDLKSPIVDPHKDANLQFSETPIKDEGIFIGAPSPADANRRKESFRKRSVSLDDPTSMEEQDEEKADTKDDKMATAPPSPSREERLSIKSHSPFHSSESLATRDNSDGIWNESQATIMTPSFFGSSVGSYVGSSNGKLTPTSKRKHLLLQHQQRSSMDTDALDMEDIADQVSCLCIVRIPLPPLPVTVTATSQSTVSPTTIQSVAPLPSTATNGTIPSPSTAATQSANAPTVPSSSRHPPATAIAPSPRFEHAKLKGLDDKDLLGDGGAGSEGSTTEDYNTCTDNSKRTITATSTVGGSKGIFKTTHTIRQPTSKQVTANATQEGSSFESASSLYSLARVDAICEDTPPIEERPSAPQIPPLPKPSPTHSVSSSSSGSYKMANKKRTSSPSRQTIPKTLPAKTKIKPESISDDERSEKRYSSSHDEKDIKGTVARPTRRGRDWNEEERRRKKSLFKLEFDKDSLKTYTTPMRQPSPGFKKLSPEDKGALNTLDGTSPSSKQKRFRPKTRKLPRSRTSVGGGEESVSTPMRRVKTPLIRSPEKMQASTLPVHTVTTPKLSPSQYYSQIRSPPSGSSPLKQKISPEKRLKAKSTESLRSVSPGSDSVFYSEADGLSQSDKQIHCHHCGKDVEVVSVPGESEGSMTALTLDSTDGDRPDIVQPPEGFADSPDCTKTPHHTRLYKKMDKRFRSEDRHADRRHFKSRQEYRAKSEERGKDDSEQGTLRPAGSSPCVAPVAPYSDHQVEPEQGVYHGNYKAGLWICIADRDVWRRHDLLGEGSFDRPPRDLAERRGSTESEKDFRKKYQAITHRLVHRKSCVEMYRRQNTNSFGKGMETNFITRFLDPMCIFITETDKTVVVCRKSGEFGFRIHGSKPVVVSAIEPDTPAESSGLEVGDIVLSVNGISVIDKSHSEVVKIAHAGSDTLELEVARTIGVLSPLEDTTINPAIYSGFLWRLSSSSTTKWVRRWFSLRPDHCLYFYKSELDIQPIGAIILTNHKVERLGVEAGGRPFAFAIETEEGTKVKLAGDTDEAASRWIAIISHAAQQNDLWLDTSARNLRLPPNGIPKPDCVGPLTKLGSKWRSWTKRYCVLKDAVLYFYHESTSKNAFGMACLQGYRVQPSSAGGKKYAFEIVPPELTLRHYYFHTDTEMDKKRWVAALEYSIDRWMKAG